MKYTFSKLIPIITIFFFWGFVAASNDILIPVFKETLNLEQWQSQMIAFAFYVAYTVGSILFMFYARIGGEDLISKIGYKRGLMLGLLVSALGTLLFIPAAWYNSFVIMLSGLFIVGLGFSLQQIVANPLTIAMGPTQTGAQRLSLAGGINNIGTTIGPVIISYAIYGSVSDSTIVNLGMVKTPYLILGAAFILMAIIIAYSNIPSQAYIEQQQVNDTDVKTLKHFPQLIMGMIAIFVYVGVEVSTASNLPELMKQEMGVSTSMVAPFVSLYWASLMIGRWTSAADAFTANLTLRKALRFIMPYAAFALFLVINLVAGHATDEFYIYVLPVGLLILADLYCMGNAFKQLFVFSLLGIASLVVGMFTSGITSVYAIICVGLFCSTLWPCIFNIAIKGIGSYVNKGSSLLIMMIMGGGIISLLQGKLADDALLGIKHSYWVGVFCFAYLAYYAHKFRYLKGV
jgi:FHS family L-fucose permease-like MFS transporter